MAIDLERYKRSTISDSEPHVCHDGDCNIYFIGICTCGLLHACISEKFDDIVKIYPKYEKDLAVHEANLLKLQDIHRGEL